MSQSLLSAKSVAAQYLSTPRPAVLGRTFSGCLRAQHRAAAGGALDQTETRGGRTAGSRQAGWPNRRSGFRCRRRPRSPRDRAPAVLGLATRRRRRGRSTTSRGAGAAGGSESCVQRWPPRVGRRPTTPADACPVLPEGGSVTLLLGPALRHVSETTALVWVQTESAATVEVLGCSARTFAVQGHHYALVMVTGLTPDTVTEYDVKVDGELVWPQADSPFPPSVIRTRGPRRLTGYRRSSDRADTPRPTTRRSTPNSGSMRLTCTPPGWPRSRSTTGRRR